MRWFKHMTASAQDEKLAALQDQCGLAGYGFFWRVLELIASHVDESGKNYCSYSKQAWCRMLAINHQTWSKMIASCGQLGIFVVSNEGQAIRVESPNILKYRDEWSRKKSKNSGVTPESLRSKEQIQIQNKEEEYKIQTPDPGTTKKDPSANDHAGEQGGKAQADALGGESAEGRQPGVTRETHPASSPVLSAGSRDRDGPGIDFVELRELYSRLAREEPEEAGYAEFKRAFASSAWPGMSRVCQAVCDLAERDYDWARGFAPGLGKFIRERGWTKKPGAGPPPSAGSRPPGFRERREAQADDALGAALRNRGLIHGDGERDSGTAQGAQRGVPAGPALALPSGHRAGMG